MRLTLTRGDTGAAALVEAAVFEVYGAQTALESGLRALASVASRGAFLPLAEGAPTLVYRVVSGQRGPEFRGTRPGY